MEGIVYVKYANRLIYGTILRVFYRRILSLRAEERILKMQKV
jgi:hypothetical protein